MILSGLFLPYFLRPNLIYTLGGNGHTFTRIQEAKTIKKIDILFIGSSRAYRGFDTRMYQREGFSTFNLGTSNQTPIQSLFLLNKYLSQLQPRMIIFEVNPDIFSNDGTESAIDIISNDTPDLAMLKMVWQMNKIRVWNTMIFSTFNKWVGREKKFKEAINKNGQTYIKGGYVSTENNNFDRTKELSYFCKLNKDQLAAFEKIRSMSDRKGIKFLLIQAPVTSALYQTCTENEHFDQLMNERAAYHNYNVLINFKDSVHFSDGQHLNGLGVEMFNKEILKLVHF